MSVTASSVKEEGEAVNVTDKPGGCHVIMSCCHQDMGPWPTSGSQPIFGWFAKLIGQI